MKFKVGNSVVIKKTINESTDTYCLDESDFREIRDKVMIVEKVWSNNSDDMMNLSGDRGYSWNQEMFELYKEKPSTEYISIIRNKNRVIATVTNGEDKFTQYVKLSDANNDYKTAVKMVIDRLMERWNGFEVEEIEAVDKPLTADGFDWEGFKAGKFAVHCDTEEKAREFLKECDEHGIVWQGGDIASSHTNYVDYGTDTCYCNYMMNKDRIGFSPIDYFREKGIDIIGYTPSKPTVKEVHRPAKVGEWVKVTSIHELVCHDRKVGDVFKIDGANEYLDKDGYIWGSGLSTQHYIVLENYQPEEPKPVPSKDDVVTVKKVSRRAEPGDWVEIIKIVKEDYYKIGDILHIVLTNRSMPYPYYRDESGCYLYDDEYLVLENFNPNNLPSTEKPDISILDNFTFEDIAKYLFHKVGDGK